MFLKHEWTMELTKSFPRRPRDTTAGITIEARTADEGDAFSAGTLGEYHYDCRMDRMHSGLLATDRAEFLDAVLSSRDDTGVPEQITEKSPPRRTEKSTPTTRT